ncbi:hypothetical protein [Microlunatus parietis]|uniref:Tissue inhibitor of metalloproteinase n=1 Tax=Microlunatus parietis TaxID=682979 RepID=A0A7Y9I2N6_9ACTN|nr:hypothetical protein [Microlunatus parietis]NYE69125.1 hypothetical protein [Microlunatus parietis]
MGRTQLSGQHRVNRRPRGFAGLLTAILVLIAGCAFVVIGAPPAHACECEPPTRPQAVQRADVIMYGTVRSVRPVSDPASGHEFTVAVRYVYKGTAYSEQIVQTPDAAACGFVPTIGSTMLIFATERQEPSVEHAYELVTTQCDGSMPANSPPRDLGTPLAPLTGSSADVGAAERTDATIGRIFGTVALVIIGIALVGGAALFWLWRPGRTPR